MKAALSAVICALVLSVCLTRATASDPRQPAEWTLITYPGINPPSLRGKPLNLRIERDSAAPPRGIFSGGPGLKFLFEWNGLDGGDGGRIFEKGYMKVRLHYPDGRVVEPVFESGHSVIVLGSGPYYQKFFTFPFGKNNLDEAWFELRMDGRSDWFEIPYGLTLPPGAPMPPSDPKGPPTAPAPAMKKGTKKDDIIRWDTVRFAIRTIQNDWKLEMEMLHRGDIRCLIRLRRGSGRWDIPKPVTRMWLEKDGGGSLQPGQISSRLPEFSHTPGKREDEFTFGYDCEVTGRLWGDLTITVDGQPQIFTIPLGFFLVGLWIPPWG